MANLVLSSSIPPKPWTPLSTSGFVELQPGDSASSLSLEPILPEGVRVSSEAHEVWGEFYCPRSSVV